MKTLTYEMSKKLMASPKWKVKQVGDCLEWQGYLDKENGYGLINANLGYGHQQYLVHRVAFIYANGYELPDMVVHHKCSNRRCCNPDHLEPRTIAENIMAEGSQSIQKLNSLKTKCPQGHPLAPPNLLTGQLKRGIRECRTCFNERQREKRKLKRRELNELLSRRETDYQFTQKF